MNVIFKLICPTPFSIRFSSYLLKRLHIQRVIFQDRIWHALLHLMAMKWNFTAAYQSSIRWMFSGFFFWLCVVCLFLHTHRVYGVVSCCVCRGSSSNKCSSKKRIRMNLFNCEVSIRMLFMVFKVIAMRAMVSVWNKNGKRITLNVLSIHSFFSTYLICGFSFDLC